MSVDGSLKQVRKQWVGRIAHELAKGEGVRAGFTEQLERFYDGLEQSVSTGDTAWLDPILTEWGQSSTETGLERGDYDVSSIMIRMLTITLEVLREALDDRASIEAASVVVPILTQGLAKVIRYEMESRVAHIASDLVRVQEKLRELDRSKSNFISVAAHELKTPLTLIEGYTSMMSDTIRRLPGDESVGTMLAGVETGIQRLRQIVDDMIDVSLVDNNMLKIHPQPVGVRHLLRLLQNEIADSIAARNQNLVIDSFEGETATILGDLARLFQALRNVVTNAIKYTPDHGTITIGGRLLPGFVELTVADTGIGIPLEHQASIFDKFGQVGRTDLHSSGRIKFKGGGPGLGLPIARGILEAHGGSIWVESPGQDEVKLPGSKFHILLPLQSPAESRAEEDAAGPSDGLMEE